MDNIFLSIFQIGVLIFSAVIHEVSHGYAALSMGDQTAKFYGRLTLNPLKHIDIFGSVLMPLFLFMATNGRFVFAYAKPVPVNPDNLKDSKYGPAKVALAGPASNLGVALLLGLVIRGAVSYVPGFASSFSLELMILVVYINVLLAVFNLIPIPPLDGSRLFFTFLPHQYRNAEMFLEKWGMVILLGLMFFGGFGLLYPLMSFVVTIFTGIRI